MPSDCLGEVLRKIYFDNARKLLVRSLPLPTLEARFSRSELAIDGKFDEQDWKDAAVARIESGIRTGQAHPELSTTVRALWTTKHLYLAYEAPFKTLKTFTPRQEGGERMGLWDRDVVEAFLAPDPDKPDSYCEFEVAPTGEELDLRIRPGEKDFDWSSGFEAAVTVNKEQSVWHTEMRIPLEAVAPGGPHHGRHGLAPEPLPPRLRLPKVPGLEPHR